MRTVFLEVNSMTMSKAGIFAIMLVIIAVAIAGCTNSTQQAPAAGNTPSGNAASPAAPAATGASAKTTVAAGSEVAGNSVLASVPYSWVEYKTVTSAEGTKMTMYYKYDKKGTCTVRFEGEDMPSGGMTMDCSASGQAQNDPNDVEPNVKFTFVGIEPVTVAAGTYPTASKYKAVVEGQTFYYWTASNVPTFVKMESVTNEGKFVTELNGWG